MNNLFVYGTLKSGELNSSYLKGSRFIAEGKTLEEFCMYKLKHFPIVTEDKVVPIQGELYRVTDEVLESIDDLENVMFKREEIPVQLLMSGVVKAWMYIWQGETKNEILIREGIWR